MSWPLIQNFLYSLNNVDYIVLSVNLLLIIFAHPILKRFSSGGVTNNTMNMRTNLLRGLNVIIVLVYAYQYLYLPSGGETKSVTILTILAILYLTYFSNFLIQYFIDKQYGKERKIGEKVIYIPTYQSRLLSILATIFLTIIAIISIIQQLGFDSLLEAGGVIGFIGVFLGLTQASWAPDIISGLIILNSDVLEEGDIVETDDNILGRVHKTKMFHTEILNMTNNHRIMVRNEHLRNKTIHNLSRFASGSGLRECLSFKISYDTSSSEIKEMLLAAFNAAVEKEVPLESNPEPEVKVLNTGDYAVEWGVIYHIKQVEHIIRIRRDLRESILEFSKNKNISLSTPILATPIIADQDFSKILANTKNAN